MGQKVAVGVALHIQVGAEGQVGLEEVHYPPTEASSGRGQEPPLVCPQYTHLGYHLGYGLGCRKWTGTMMGW
jgi:hypothetical protein